MLWEGRHSWLIDSEVKKKIKELGGTLVAKSLNKDPAKAATIWRLSLNSSPIFDKVFKHLSQQGCNAKTVLKLIKDIKKIAFEDKERSILKSYNVRQALLHCADELEGQKITEASLLIAIMEKVSFFLERAFFPAFLEEKRNLIFNWSAAEQCSEGHQKLQEVEGSPKMGVHREPGAEQQEGGTLVQIFEANQRGLPNSGFQTTDS